MTIINGRITPVNVLGKVVVNNKVFSSYVTKTGIQTTEISGKVSDTNQLNRVVLDSSNQTLVTSPYFEPRQGPQGVSGWSGMQGPQGVSGWSGIRGEDGSPGAAGGVYQAFANTTNVTVQHNFHNKPIINVLDDQNRVVIPKTILHNNDDSVTIVFSRPSSGTVIASFGGGGDLSSSAGKMDGGDPFTTYIEADPNIDCGALV